MPYVSPQSLLPLSTALGDDLLVLRSVRGRESVSGPFEFELKLGASSSDVEIEALLGTALSFGIDDEGERFFHGFVSQIAADNDAHRADRLYVARVVPWMWFLTKSVDCRVFQNATVPSILEQIFAEHGFGDCYRLDLRGDYSAREYCVQYAESTADFAHRLMEEEGIYYSYEHDSDGHTLVLADTTFGYMRSPVEALTWAADDRHQDRLGKWSHEYIFGAARASFDAFDFSAPRKNHRSEIDSLIPAGSFERYEYAGELRGGTPRPEERARRAIEAQEVELESVRGRSSQFTLTTLQRVRIRNHPEVGKAGSEYVTIEVEHEASDPSYESIAGANPYRNRFLAIPSHRTFRPARRKTRPLIAGPQTAVVVGPEDEELHVDEHGRVRVRFHWDREGGAPGDNSCWIRAAQPWAGKGHGFQFLPRVGDEVLVSFMGGDPDQPIIVGSVFNGDNRPVHDPAKYKDHSGIKTHSIGAKNGFNELRFEDRSGRERVFLHSQRRLDVRAGGSAYETMGGSREVRVGGEEGGLNTHVAHDVNSHVVNDRFELTDGESHRVVGGADFERSESGRRAWVGETYEITAADLVVQTSGQASSFSTEQLIEGTHEVSLKGGRIHIEAKAELCLKVGSNHIKIDATGIHIEGLPLNLNCGSTPTSGPGAETISDLPEPRRAFDAYSAYTGKPSQGTRGGGGGGRSRPRTNDPVPTPAHQPKVFVPPPPPGRPTPPTVDPDAAIAIITAKCEHSGETGLRTVSQGGQLDVVPGDSIGLTSIGTVAVAVPVDNIELKAIPKPDAPPAEVEWRVAGPGGSERVLLGETVSVPVQASYAESAWIPDHEPASYAVEARASGASDTALALAVRAFPPPLEVPQPDLSLLDMLTEPLSTAGDLVWAWTGLFNLEVNPGKAWVEAGWRESSGPKALFGYDVGAEFLPVLRFEGKIPIGPSLGKVVLLIKRALRSAKVLGGDHLKRFNDVLDRLVDVGVHGIMESNVKLDFRFKRDSLSQPLFVEAEANHEDNRVGLSGTNWLGLRTLLPIPAPFPLTLVTPTMGNTFMEAWIGLSYSAKPFIDEKGYGLKDYGIAFEGLSLFGQYVDPTLTQTLDVLGTRDEPYPLIGASDENLVEVGKHYLGEWKDIRRNPTA